MNKKTTYETITTNCETCGSVSLGVEVVRHYVNEFPQPIDARVTSFRDVSQCQANLNPPDGNDRACPSINSFETRLRAECYRGE